MAGTIGPRRRMAKWLTWVGLLASPSYLSAAAPQTARAPHAGAAAAQTAARPAQTNVRNSTPNSYARLVTAAAGRPTAVQTRTASAARGNAPTARQIPTTAPESPVAPASVVFADEAIASCDDCVQSAGIGRGGCWPIWGQFEYLLWWDQDSEAPALATSSPTGTNRDDAGVLGLSTTNTLFGNEIATDSTSGGRITLGLWIDPCQNFGIFGRGFSLGEQSAQFNAQSAGPDILGRPFFNAFSNEEDALLIGFPGALAGELSITQDTDVSGAQALVRQAFRAGGNYRIDLVYGYRYLGVDEAMRIDNTLEFIDAAAATFGTTIDQTDLFDIENEFHGGELGLMGHSVDGRWTLDFLATVALGTMNQLATVSGTTTTTPPTGTPVSVEGGLLTQTSNIGTFKDDPFTVVPEVTVTLGYFITPRLDLAVGYTFLYVDNVARPADVIDRSVNLTQQTGQLDGPANPAFALQDSGYWLQGLNLGINLRY